MSNKHPHAEMIKAFLDNTEICVLINHEDEGKWLYANPGALLDYQNQEFFACLPQHKEAVLNVLNGGESQTYREGGTWKLAVCGSGWNSDFWYMREDKESRIKPRKEERWIAVSGDATSNLYKTRRKLELIYGENKNPNVQFVRLEIEV